MTARPVLSTDLVFYNLVAAVAGLVILVLAMVVIVVLILRGSP